METSRIENNPIEWLLCGLLCLPGLALFAFVVHAVMNGEHVVDQAYIPHAVYVPPPLLAKNGAHVTPQKQEAVQSGTVHVVSNTSQFPTQDTPPPPRYGADAVGEPGAWDGNSEEGTNSPPQSQFSSVAKDKFGNPCPKDPSQLSIDELRSLVPQKGAIDECWFRKALWFSSEVTLSDVQRFFNNGMWITPGDLKHYLEGGKWSIADFEELLQRHSDLLHPLSVLSIYLILKEAHSPLADNFPSDVDREDIDEYLKDGVCPHGRGKYCFPFY